MHKCRTTAARSEKGMELCINEYNQAWRTQSVPTKNNDESWDVLRKVGTNIKQNEYIVLTECSYVCPLVMLGKAAAMKRSALHTVITLHLQ